MVIKLSIFFAFFVPTLYIHFRGRVRHKLHRQLTDHSVLMAPFNTLIYLFSAVENKPILDAGKFADLRKIRENWTSIRDEALALYQSGHIKTAATYNDLAFNSFFRRGWKRFYFKWYGRYLPSACELCPQTVEILRGVKGLNAALLALLPPHSRLGQHRDPYAGSLRYHLGLVTPNSDACRIWVDGQAYSWRDGQDFLFDETFIHWAENDTDQPRIILFCDIERPLRFAPMRLLNRVVRSVMGRATVTENLPGDGVGILNHAFNGAYRIRLAGEALKRLNKHLYYALKYALLLGLAFWFFL